MTTPRPLRPWLSATTYRRWVHLLLGGVLCFPFYLAVLVAGSLVRQGEPSVSPGLGSAAIVVAVAFGATAALSAEVRSVQRRLARSLLQADVPDQEPSPAEASTVRRSVAWLAGHLFIGFAVAVGTMIALTEAGLLALAPFVDEPETLLLDRFVEAATDTTVRWAAPIVALGIVTGWVLVVWALGWGAARLAPAALGPSPSERLALALAHADRLEHRARLAAELHDSVGHALSVVALQAGAAARLLDDDPPFARQALDTIADQARAATAELDHVLGLLRQDDDLVTAPAPTLTDVPDLVAASRTPERDIDLQVRGDLGRVPTLVSREAYRVCQEALTNALRHGAPDAPADVLIDAADDRLRIEVVNAVRDASHVPDTGRSPSGGHGIEQLRSRLAVLGGTLDAGVDGGVWRLTADLPRVRTS